ncbi:MAG TPA: hypothetical protein PK625_01840 [Spirochaetales bacterium]|nr:hypothetical protein [Spirochaetales bacterium]
MKRAALLLFFLCAAAAAQGPETPSLPDDPAELLGLTPAQALERYGAPARVYAVRGQEAWQDDVVFDYGVFSLFLFGDKVWQVRVSVDYPLPVLGFMPGSDLERVQAALGLPASSGEDYTEWDLPGQGWPVRLRIATGQDGRTDLYIYRADF